NNASLYRVEGDLMRKIAGHGSIRTTQQVGGARPVTRGSVIGRAMVERRTLHIADLLGEVDTEYPVARDNVRREGIRTFVATPLLRANVSIGAIAVYRTEVRPLSDKQISLLQTFADQAVIAIENVRLFKELEGRNTDLTELLEQQTATSDILSVIAASPTDIQPVLDAVVRSATRLCEGYDAWIGLTEGENLRARAHQGPIAIAQELRPLKRGRVSENAVLDRRTIHVHDLAASGAEFPQGHA